MLNIEDIKNTVLNAKSDEILKEIPDESIDLVVTSPPYDDLRDYENATSWNFEVFTKIADELYRVIKKGGVVVWVVGDKVDKGSKTLTSFKQAIYFKEIGFNVHDVMLYEKACYSFPQKTRYANAFEYMFIFSKGKPKTVNLIKDKPNRWAGWSSFGTPSVRLKDGTLKKRKEKHVTEQFSARTNIWKYANGHGNGTKDDFVYEHPATFPEKLAEDHIISWSNPGDIVLDPFGGSGTTGKMAMINDRNFILIEAVPKYCDIINKRIDMYKNYRKEDYSFTLFDNIDCGEKE